MKGSDPKSIGEPLREFLARSPLVRQSRAARRWDGVWGEVAPRDALAHTSVRGLRHGVLTIAVDSPPLCHELASFGRASLLSAMNARRGDATPLRDLHFRHGPI
jgi:predicted nucleic acid-binding Zn ribbon protein